MWIEWFEGTYERNETEVSLEKDLFAFEQEIAMQQSKSELTSLMASVEFDESNFEHAAYPHYDAEGVLV